MPTRRLLDLGSGTLRVSLWRGDHQVAHLTPYARNNFPPTTIQGVVDQLTAEGFERAITSALAPAEQSPFLENGFSPRHRLALLTRSLQNVPRDRTVALRRGRRRDREIALAIDATAFTGFWRLDSFGLDDALTATPSSRFRFAMRSRPLGYAICGRAGTVGYIQRLAVEPGSQRSGLGRALVSDGLRWMARRGASQAYVNTADDNVAALGFYTRLGFDVLPHGLAVLERSLGAAAET